MPADDDQPATKKDLRDGLRELEQRMATKQDLRELETATKRDLLELKQDLLELRTATKQDLLELRTATKQDLRELEQRLTLELARAVNTVIEQIGSKIGVVDEKYQELPGRLTAHEQDFVLHNRPPAPRVARKTKPKR